MSRVEFSGQGYPIPLEALPSEFAVDTAPLLLTLLDGVDFIPDDYISFGFTHYEAICIGAVGGRGGDASSQVNFFSTTVQVTVSTADWNLYKEITRIQDFYTSGEWDHQYLGGAEYGPDHMATAVEILEINNPTHKLPVTTYSGAELVATSITDHGGSGGGGGLHMVSGLLDDLPEEVPVAVGAPGIDAPVGQIQVNGLWTPLPYAMTSRYNSGYGMAYPQGRLRELSDYFNTYQYKYPGTRTSFAVPVIGGDGGTSTFGDICRASGGKSGNPCMVWGGSAFVPDAAGGEGGSGLEVVAGGGAAGAVGAVNGSDGTWDGEVGEGGGGGRGGGSTWAATNGGQGSYSFSDTSVFGARQYKSGDIGGTGGGARPLDKKYGSEAPSYSPEGVVLIRVYQVV